MLAQSQQEAWQRLAAGLDETSRGEELI